MSFDRPSLSAIVARSETDMSANLPGADGQLRVGVLPALIRSHAGVAHGLYGYLDHLALQIMPDTADADELARWSVIWGVARKAAASAEGEAVATGVDGTIVPAGTRLLRSDGVAFTVDADATIAGGTATLDLTAEVAGAASNSPAAAKLRFVSPIDGAGGEVTIAAPGLVAGADVETDAALLGRLLTRIQQPPHGGASFDYLAWAKEVAGVTRAWVYAAELGLGTVTVRFMRDGDDDPIPEPAEVADVQAYIDERRPVTANVTVVAPIADPLEFQIRVTPSSAAVKAAVEAELRDLISRDAIPGGSILLSRIREAVSIAAGETDNEVVAPVADVATLDGHIVTFDSITWVP